MILDKTKITAYVHDSIVDLSEKEEVVYRVKRYSGTTPNGHSATMKKGARNHPIEIKDKLRNKKISNKRAVVERAYAVIKTVFKSTQGLTKLLQ